jgi:chromosome partitioning protein
MTRIITVANQKGGVGKTTSTVNIAAAIAQAGHSVVVIDMDPQGNASTALGAAHHEGTPSIYEVLTGELALVDVLQPCPDVPGLWTAPATIDLAGAEIELVAQVAREYRLARAVDALLEQRPVDFVILDCPPSLGLLTLNGLVAAREVLLPIQCEYYALEGLSQLLRTIEMVRTHLNPGLRVGAILLTMYDGRTRLASQVAQEVRTHFGEQVLATIIPRSVRVSEAPSYGQTVVTYDPTSSGALAYREAAMEVVALDTAHPQSYPQT